MGLPRRTHLRLGGEPGDEADPDSPHGWMCRLVDSSALTAAGFKRVQKARLDVLEP